MAGNNTPQLCCHVIAPINLLFVWKFQPVGSTRLAGSCWKVSFECPASAGSMAIMKVAGNAAVVRGTCVCY